MLSRKQRKEEPTQEIALVGFGRYGIHTSHPADRERLKRLEGLAPRREGREPMQGTVEIIDLQSVVVTIRERIQGFFARFRGGE